MPTYPKSDYCSLKMFFILFFLISISQPALSDEALLKVYGGGLKMLDEESTSVRMEFETVRIELHKKTYTVDATFEFFNYGNTLTAQVGFPKSGYGYTGIFKGVISLNSFETWVNGENVKVKEMPGEVTLDRKKIDQKQHEQINNGTAGGWLEETRWLVKKVTFKGNSKTVTRVKYTVPYGVGGHTKMGEYLYGTGKSWKGTIGKARFIIKASSEVSLLGHVSFTENGYFNNIRKYGFKRLGGYEYEYTLEDFEPKENENLKFDISLNSEPWQELTSEYTQQIVDSGRLEHFSLWGLKILKNSIYASHGKIFKDQELDAYFRKYDWYKPRADFKEIDLTKREQESVKTILDYEEALKFMPHRK